MARRVIATAEVQVASDVSQAEAGLEGLTETFRRIGATAERAAEKAEAAFFKGATTIRQAFGNAEDAVLDVIQRLDQGNDKAQSMARSFLTVAASISKAQQEGQSFQTSTEQMLSLLRQAAAAAGIFENNLEDAAGQAAAALRQTQEIEGAIRAAEIRAEMLGKAFRDVGQDIQLAMAGGFEQVEDDILSTIRRLKDLGGEFREVGLIGERALDDIGVEADENLREAARAAMRLAQQLREVEQVELNRLESEARAAAAALNQTAVAAQRADRSIDGIGNVTRRVSGDVRGLVGLLGAAGLGYAAMSAAKSGIEMTRQ